MKRRYKMSNQVKLIENAKKKMAGSTKECEACSDYQLLKTDLTNANFLIAELQEKVTSVEQKADKYKELKNKCETTNDIEYQKLGESTMIPKQKLSLCRITNYSKYVGDVLDVLFSPETLGNSVARVIKGTEKNVLDPRIVSDVQQHVVSKFDVSVQMVRAAIRQKLNVCDKLAKKML